MFARPCRLCECKWFSAPAPITPRNGVDKVKESVNARKHPKGESKVNFCCFSRGKLLENWKVRLLCAFSGLFRSVLAPKRAGGRFSSGVIQNGRHPVNYRARRCRLFIYLSQPVLPNGLLFKVSRFREFLPGFPKKYLYLVVLVDS